MRQSNQIDLRNESGAKTVTLTPGGTGLWTINGAQRARIGAGGGGRGLWNTVRGVNFDFLLTVARSTGGTTPVYGDQFPRVIKSINFQTPLHGTILDPTVVTGMVLAEIAENFGMGGRKDGVRRLPIPGADASYVRALEMYYPFPAFDNDDPDDFNQWLGWLNDGTIEIIIEDAAQPFGLSGVTITNVVCQISLDMVPKSELIIPPFIHHTKYDITAGAGTTGPTLMNVGASGKLNGMDDGSRLLSMLYSHQVGGFIGSGTADQITSIQLGWRDQDNTTLPSHLFQRFLRDKKWFRAGLDATGADAVDIVDSTVPYTMPAGPAQTTRLNDPTARYTPLVWEPRVDWKISQFQKVRGNLPIDIVFSAGQSGQMRVYTRELKQYSLQMVSQMCAAANVEPSTVEVVPKLSRKNWYYKRDASGSIQKVTDVDPAKFFCFPRTLRDRAAK